VVFNEEEFSTGNNTIVFTAFENEKPVFSAGVPIEGWRQSGEEITFLPENAKGRIWTADVPEGIENPVARFLAEDLTPLVNAMSEELTTAEDENVEIPRDDFM